MAARYDVGDVARLTGTFTDIDDDVIDPETVACKVRKPSGTITTYTYDADITKSSTGIYYIDVDITEPGRWWNRYYSTGTGKAAGEQEFEVRESHF